MSHDVFLLKIKIRARRYAAKGEGIRDKGEGRREKSEGARLASLVRKGGFTLLTSRFFLHQRCVST
jgi:hypothetical protein